MNGIARNKQGLKILITGSALQLFLGIIYVWSVFVQPVSAAWSWDIPSVRLMTSYMLCFFVLGILAGGKLQTKIGADKIVLTGGLMLALGMLATAFVTSSAPWISYITYGIIGGFGVGAAYNAVITAAQKWFPENRGFATGVSVCAFGFSTVIFAPLVGSLIGAAGVANTFLILSAAFATVVLAFFSFIKLPEDGNGASSAAAAIVNKRQYTTSEAIKTKEFYLITLSLMLGISVFFILNPSLVALGNERAGAGALLVMISGVANALGRLGAPLLSEKIGSSGAAAVIIALTALCAALLCVSYGVFFMILVCVIAFCYGGYSGIYPVITADYFGLKNVGANYGTVMVGFAAAALVFPMLVNTIQDMTAKFIILAAAAAVGAILTVVLMLGKKGAK